MTLPPTRALGRRRIRARDHDAVHVRDLVTENAADFLPLLDQRQGAGMSMTPVLTALTAGRGSAGALHARLADAIDGWAAAQPDPHHHAHWLG